MERITTRCNIRNKTLGEESFEKDISLLKTLSMVGRKFKLVLDTKEQTNHLGALVGG